MRTAIRRTARPVPVSSQAGLRLAGIPVGRTERAIRREGKIEGTGTMSGRFPKFLLSAHWLAGPQAAPRFWEVRAAIVCNPLVLQNFHRHYGGEVIDFRPFLSRPHP